ncbi:MAG: hypothetical protein WC979_07120 [Candidatus Pacearchaeota archaeon]|jgi:hypothetical protein
MTLASNYLDYASSVANFLKNPSNKTYRTTRVSAKTVQESWYGVSIEPPRVLDGLEETLKLLLSGSKNAWDSFLRPLTSSPIVGLGYNSVAPVYHKLVSIQEKLLA